MRSAALSRVWGQSRSLLYGLPLLVSCGLLPAAAADRYVIGSPTLTDLWVDPVNGSDANSGATRTLALRTITAAWNIIPAATTLATTGYRIQLLPGTFPEASLPNFWESRHGTYQFPGVWLKVPTVGEVTLIDVGAGGSFSLPANLDTNLAPFSLLNTFPPRRSWELNGRVANPTTGATLSEDVNPFDVQ